MIGLAAAPRCLAALLVRTLAILLLGAARSVTAAELPSVMLDDLTSPELAQAIARGFTTVLVPIGGTEQNGPYMALGKHNVRARVLAERIARTLGNAIVAPVIAYVPEGNVNPPTAHMRFPGTITVPDRAFEAILESAARSFRLHGFRDVVFLGDHGSYQTLEQAVATRLNREWASSPVRVHAMVEYYDLAAKRYSQMLREQGYRDAEIGTHAGLADTSLALAVDPTLVRAGGLRSESAPTAAQGVYGDPRRSSAELGATGVDVIVAETAKAIRKAASTR